MEVEAVKVTLIRYLHGLEFLGRLQQLQKPLQALSKEIKDSLLKVTLGEFLEQGLRNPEICVLVQTYISNLDINSLM
jgi:hypothetical protein